MRSQGHLGLILIVEDNRDIAEALGDYLEARSFEVDYATNGLDGYRLAAEGGYDAIILDGMLPRLDGIDFCRKLRTEARVATPIVFVTARDTVESKVAGLEAGADDYITKPFSPKELELRLKALLRRQRGETSRRTFQVADLIYDPTTMLVTRAGKPLFLSPTGLKLLHMLMRESPRVISRQEIEREVWGDELPESDSLRSHIYNLRRTIDRGFDRPLLSTVAQAGFRLADTSEPLRARQHGLVDRPSVGASHNVHAAAPTPTHSAFA